MIDPRKPLSGDYESLRKHFTAKSDYQLLIERFERERQERLRDTIVIFIIVAAFGTILMKVLS